MAKNTIITIGRQYGSGGREIGKKLADTLGIPFYDKELLSVAAKESGICRELFESNDEKPTSSLLYSLFMGTYTGEMPITQKLFLAQFEAIQKIARDGSCVIVGRCADYALREFPNCVNVFIHAGIESRIARLCRLYQITESQARETITKTDKRRANYYNFYSNRKWGELSNYHLTVDTEAVGVDNAVELIASYVRARENFSGEL